MNNQISIFYRDDMAPADVPDNYSKSPTKPRRFIEFLRGTPLWPHIEIHNDFEPLTRDQVLLAHEPHYVDAFLTGEPTYLAESNGLRWSPAFRDSVLLTNSCLLAAVLEAIDHPEQLTMAPVSGFHHARPSGGGGFCTFSGQVIAGLQLYRQWGLRGAWVDLDGHFGNSIEDSRAFAPDLDQAIKWNINPQGMHLDYLCDLQRKMYDLRLHCLAGEIDYVCVAHGADSHEWDQLGHQCTTDEWLRAADEVYRTLADIRQHQRHSQRPLTAVTLALFGGYRDDDPASVLGLHAMDTARALTLLSGASTLADYRAEVLPPARINVGA